MTNDSHSPHLPQSTTIPLTHRGPIPGIHVGQSWQFRHGCSLAGVHRATMSGIAGSAKNGGAVSIVVSGGYPEDVDHGTTFVFTGSGGRDANDKATAAQSKDQELTRVNLALAMTCNAKVNKTGAVAKDWKNSLEIRVLRGSKLDSKFAPEEGYRYDGIYKIVKYEFSKGVGQHMVYRFHFRRDDNTPTPWSAAGKKLIKSLGLRMVLRDDMETKSKPTKVSEPLSLQEQSDDDKDDDPLTYASIRRKRGPDFASSLIRTSHCREVEYSVSVQDDIVAKAEARNSIIMKSNIPSQLKHLLTDLVEKKPVHFGFVEKLVNSTYTNPEAFFQNLKDYLECPVCKEFANFPVTSPCGHVACLTCLERGVHTKFGARCTVCKDWLLVHPYSKHRKLKDKDTMKEEWLNEVNIDGDLVHLVRTFWPGYSTDAEWEKNEDRSDL